MSLSIAPPQSAPYIIGLAFVFVSQIISIPLCILAHKLRRSSAALVALGLATATLPLYVQPGLSAELQARGYATAFDTLTGRFFGASTYAFVAMRMFGAAVGATPKGADADVSVWIAFATGACDILFDEDGKPRRPPRSAVPVRIAVLAARMVGLSVVCSLSQPFGAYPASIWAEQQGLGIPAVAVATFVDHVFVHVMILWLFLTLSLDVGCLLLVAQGYQTLEAFDNPIFKTRSARDFWGKRWNIQVNTTLKRGVFVPLRKAGVGPTMAALITFAGSAAFHEYQFLLSFEQYTVGRAGFFFVFQGVLCAVETIVEKSLGKRLDFLASVPQPLKTLLVLIVFAPTVPLFSKIWIEEGMFDAIARLAPAISSP